MKGIVFCEFINLIDNVFGEDMVQDVIPAARAAPDNCYAASGDYEYQEFAGMITALGDQTGIPEPELMNTFGKHLADIFSKKFPDFFEDCQGTADFLKKMDIYTHDAIQKASLDADLPIFSYRDITPQEFQFSYTSTQDFADLVYGLLEGFMEYFGESYQLVRDDLHQTIETTFTLRRLI